MKEADQPLIRARVHSRHSGSTKYNVYIRYNPSETGAKAIESWLCRCKNGLRTLGCCAHVTSFIYYLSYGKYQERLKSPGSFLQNLFPHAQQITLESSDEED